MLKRLYEKNNRPAELEQICSMLRDGALVIYPTDTLYAIGCSALAVRAVERICNIKKVDPRKNNLSVLCRDFSQAAEYARISDRVFRLMKKNLPGPFTFILPTGSKLPHIFRLRKEVGIRIPAYAEYRCRLYGRGSRNRPPRSRRVAGLTSGQQKDTSFHSLDSARAAVGGIKKKELSNRQLLPFLQ